MKLFAIRMEAGDIVLLAAANEEEAVNAASLTMEAVANVLAQLSRQAGATIDAETVTRGGVGPQQYEIRELSVAGFSLEFKLINRADLNLSDIDPRTFRTIFEMYPMVRAAVEQAAETWPDAFLVEEERPNHDRLIAVAVDQERNRLRRDAVDSMHEMSVSVTDGLRAANPLAVLVRNGRQDLR
jgi:hypothetical protein